MAAFRNRVRASPYGRALRFLPWPLQLLLLAACAVAVPLGILLFAVDQHDRSFYGLQRRQRIDTAILHESPDRVSAYCRKLFGDGAYYRPCWADERRAYLQFAEAWARGKGLSTVREYMITCFSEAQMAEGTSWKTATTCSEADVDGPVPSPGR